MTQRILVTGGAGFLGSHLCRGLLSAENNVICVDNCFKSSKKNIHNFTGQPYFDFAMKWHNVTFSFYVDVEQIHNLSCPASPIHYQNDPVHTTKTSVHGTINMLGFSKRVNAHALQASTSEVFGNTMFNPQTEDYCGRVNPIGIRGCYDLGERCAEKLFFDYHRQHQLDVKVVRILNAYSPNMLHNDGRVVSNFIVQALKSEDITIDVDGLQGCSFCYADDLLDGMVKMMDSREGFCVPVNICNSTGFTALELAEEVLKQIRGAAKLIYLPLPAEDFKQRKPNISLANSELDWEPSVGLAEGLNKTITNFRKILKQ